MAIPICINRTCCPGQSARIKGDGGERRGGECNKRSACHVPQYASLCGLLSRRFGQNEARTDTILRGYQRAFYKEAFYKDCCKTRFSADGGMPSTRRMCRAI